MREAKPPYEGGIMTGEPRLMLSSHVQCSDPSDHAPKLPMGCCSNGRAVSNWPNEAVGAVCSIFLALSGTTKTTPSKVKIVRGGEEGDIHDVQT
jgi:hypothetical protein